MKHQALRPFALMLSVLLIAAVPAQASTIKFGDVIALATIDQSGRPSLDLRLRSVTQQSRAAGSQDKQAAANGNNQQERKNIQTPSATTPAGSAETNITGTNVAVQQPGSVQVETIELGDIQGTICDCGEIFTPKGGFPKLPLLALAGIPLLFLGGDGDTPPGDIVIIPPPDVTPTPQVPEPATLLLLGSGLAALGAGARRRRAATTRSNGQNDEVSDVRGA